MSEYIMLRSKASWYKNITDFYTLYGMVFWTKWQKFNKALQLESMTIYKAPCLIKILFLSLPQMKVILKVCSMNVKLKQEMWIFFLNLKISEKEIGNAWITKWEYW